MSTPSVARIVQRAARRIGLTITYYPPPDSLERLLSDLFRLREINCVLDVGAHKGGYVRFLRQNVGFRGHIRSFEPARNNYQALARSWHNDEHWQGFQYALGTQSRTAALHLFEGGNWNSLLPPNPYGTDRFLPLRHSTGTEEIAVHRLEDVFDAVTGGIIDPVVFLKVDTQGYDMDVIEGAGALLSHVVALQLELSAKPIYESQPSFVPVISRLGELGFEIAGMFPISRDRDGLRVVEFDAVFCRAVSH